MLKYKLALCLAPLAVAPFILVAGEQQQRPDQDWAVYNGDPGGTHYSALDEINLQNVGQLKQAWSYDSGDALGSGPAQSDMEGNPLIIGGKLTFISPKGRLICLDAVTGKELWAYDPADGKPTLTKQRSRGLSYWTDGKARRYFITFRKDLISIDADSGKVDTGFGDHGRVDMRLGLGRDVSTISVANVTPGAVYKNLIIMGSTGNAPGYVRAYDVRSGTIVWTFHTIPQPGEFGYDTWPKDAWKTAMGANVWAGLTIDPQSGTVFLPVGSAGMGDKDFYGADRSGDNLFGTSLVALDAATGKRRWHFQLVKHDLWDRDPPSQPTLVTVRRDGRDIPAIAQATKSGLIFVLDRATGKPLFGTEERPVFASDVPGEHAAATQLFPLKPEPFARQQLTRELLTQRTPQAFAAVAGQFAKARSRGPFDPPSERGTIIFPGLDGGAEWGGAAYDPDTGLMYVNANEMAWTLKVKPKPAQVAGSSGRALFLNNCSACHGEERQGSPPEFPSLVNVGDRLPQTDIALMIYSGGGRMPAFGSLGIANIQKIAAYLVSGKDDSAPPGKAAGAIAKAAPVNEGERYIFDGYNKFLDPDGYPGVKPPWGTLSAIDMSSGDYRWKVPFGTYPELAAQGQTDTGSENYGGAVVTKGGLLFIGATVYDNKFHAFDKRTGKLLWEVTLPAAGLATPATYRAGGHQYVVIAAGGGKNMKGKPGGSIIAFRLPE